MIIPGQKFSFGVTYDSPSLYVAAKIFDNSGASPALLATIAMANYYGNSYQGTYLITSPTLITSVLVQVSVYTDNTYTTLSTNYSQTDYVDQVQSSNSAQGASGCALTGIILQNNPIIGIILQNDPLIGIIPCKD